MAHPIDDVWLKVDRAKNHLNDLHARISQMLAPEKDAAPAGHEYHPDRQQLIVTLPKATPIDPTIPLIVGDCVHNARSALDHLVFQLAILNRAPIKSASKTSFPVYLKPGEFKNAVRGKIKPFISGPALAEIEKLQPYATGNDGESDVIWMLSQLDIIDKHRLLIVTASKFKPTGFTVKVPSGEEFSHKITSDNWKASKDGAEIMRFDLSKAISKTGEVNVKVNTARAVQIENTGMICDGMAVVPVLLDCIQHVANIVDGFSKMFFGAR
ncbi:MAG TPA: hypothetical protein VHS29_10640 [Candidatus Acidoferrales bacterium]|nr:hypothetical protein [Candidatus Acidoferrales bacterium]